MAAVFYQDLDIGVLVNNVGMSYEYPQEFLELSSTYVDTLINLNIVSLNAMTRIVLPQMVERKKGAVINISSFLAAFPTPLLSVYSASKSYVDLISQGMAKEYSSKGITVQCVLPGYVTSKLSKIRRPSLTVPTPNAFVRYEFLQIFQFYFNSTKGPFIYYESIFWGPCKNAN